MGHRAWTGQVRTATLYVTSPSNLLNPPPFQKLPSHVDDGAIDIPIPDFTFKCYPEMRYSNTSWPAVAPLLKLKSEMLPWPQRRSRLSHRSNWGVGPRRWLMPRLQKLQDEGKAVEVLGAGGDGQNTEFVASSGQKFQYVDDWCNSKYLIHTAGFSYSAGARWSGGRGKRRAAPGRRL